MCCRQRITKDILVSSLVVVFISSFCWLGSAAITCYPTICDSIECPTFNCNSHQVIRRGSGVCGCCDVCTTLLGLGEPCMSHLGPPATAQCGKGLVCMHKHCVPLHRQHLNR